MVTSITSGAAVPMSSTESANANKLCQSVVFCPVKRSLQLNWPSILFTANGRINSDFIGSTPSTLELRPGQHEITIRKKGFQPWIRKMKVTTGKMNISADLEPTH